MPATGSIDGLDRRRDGGGGGEMVEEFARSE
jgi:hypothetical protein